MPPVATVLTHDVAAGPADNKITDTGLRALLKRLPDCFMLMHMQLKCKPHPHTTHDLHSSPHQ